MHKEKSARTINDEFRHFQRTVLTQISSIQKTIIAKLMRISLRIVMNFIYLIKTFDGGAKYSSCFISFPWQSWTRTKFVTMTNDATVLIYFELFFDDILLQVVVKKDQQIRSAVYE